MKKSLFLLLVLICGCSRQQKDQLPKQFQELNNVTSYSANTEPKNDISLKKDAVYGNSQQVLIGKLGDVAVDSKSRVFIADIQKQLVHVFKPNGQFILQLGREGRGPGEFSYIRKLMIRDDLLYVADANFGIRQVHTFSLENLKDEETIVLARNRGDYKSLAKAYPGIYNIYVRNNGSYLAEFISQSSKPTQKWQNVKINGALYLIDDDGKIVSNKLAEFKEEIRTLYLGLSNIEPFFGSYLTVLSADNSIYQAGPEHFLIKKYSPKGDYQKGFYYPIKKIPLTKKSADKAGVNDYYLRNMKSMKLPETWPVLTDMKIDDQDRLWVATTVEDMGIYEWWVLKPSGELIAQFNWSRSKPIQIIKNGYIYTREAEKETGLQQIVKYRFEMD